MGAVWEAQHVETGAVRALKTLWLADDVAPDEEMQQRFRREGELQARLDHSHIVRVHQADFEGKTPYLVQDLLPGGTLASRLKTGGPFSERAAVELVEKLAGGLAHAHALGVLHRDLKPDNVLFDDRGEPCLADFGLAISLNAGSQRLSVTGMASGTPAFMAPEQAFGEKQLTVATDVYGLGTVLYAALTGKPPFPGTSAIMVMEQVVSGPVPDPRAQSPEVSAELAAVCMRALAKAPDQRHASVLELALAAREAVDPPSNGASGDRSPLRVLAAGAVAALLVVGISLALALRNRSAATPADSPSPVEAPPSPLEPQVEPDPVGELGPWRFDPGVEYYYVLQKRSWTEEGHERVLRGNTAFWLTLRTTDDPGELIDVSVRLDRIALEVERSFARVRFDSVFPPDPRRVQSAEAVRALVGQSFSVRLRPATGEIDSVEGMSPLLDLIDEAVRVNPSPMFTPGSEPLEQLKARFSAESIRRDLELLVRVIPPQDVGQEKRRVHPTAFGSPHGVAARFAFQPLDEPGRFGVVVEPRRGERYQAEGAVDFVRQYLVRSTLTERYEGRFEARPIDFEATRALLAIEPDAYRGVLQIPLTEVPQLLGTPD
jgi:hypothetical protein